MLTSFIAILFVVVCVIMLLIIKLPPKERVEDKPKSTIKEVLKGVLEPLKDNNYRFFLIAFFLFWIPFVSFQYLILPLGTFLLQLRGAEFNILAGVAFVSAIISFVVWQKISIKFGLKKTLSICLIFSAIAFFLVLILIVPMPHELLFGLGLVLISLCLCALVGTMVFPFAIISELVDLAEEKTGKSMSGAYSGAFTMMGSLASGTAMLIISIFLEIFGPEAPISYGFILAMGAFFIVVALIIFQKVQLKGTSNKQH